MSTATDATTTPATTDPHATLAALEAEHAGIDQAIIQAGHFGTDDTVGALLHRRHVLPGLVREAKRTALQDTIARCDAAIPDAEAAHEAAQSRVVAHEAGIVSARDSLARAEALYEDAKRAATEPGAQLINVRHRRERAAAQLADLERQP